MTALRTCDFSEDRRFRYLLEISWAPGPAIAFGMLNPSTADELKNDPTVERCQRRAQVMGFGRLIVWNLFAYRATDPRSLYQMANPIGPRNDAAILSACSRAAMTVVGWGTHGRLHERGAAVLALLRSQAIEPFALRVNGDGTPAHPLYIGYSVQPFKLAAA